MVEYVLNTIAFKDFLEKGGTQAELIDQTADAGFDAIEIRDEYLEGNDSELEDIKFAAQRKNIDVFYSVNDVIMDGNRVNESKLQGYIKKCRLLGASRLKMNMGIYSGKFLNMSAVIKMLGGIQMFIENNQTVSESNLADTCSFMKTLRKETKQISYCFDVANWIWLHENVDKAAENLKFATNYLHLKNVIETNGEYVVTSLNNGLLNCKRLIRKFSDIAYVGFEYPASLEVLERELAIVKEWLTEE